jgi:ATP-dependent helicase/nuclease subunit A
MSLEAANPKINATVTASAGSGKTYMLISRIVRILLDGSEPGGILALTFTRKAAAEMQQRLAERLYELATVNENELNKQLDLLGIELNDHNRQQARSLYEFHQYCDFPVRTQTFHSFCQDILTRFPLEADIPPGFDLLESSSLLIKQARNALFNEAAQDMKGQLAQNLEALVDACDGLFNFDNALKSFLDHRSDWWAFTENAEHSCAYATQILEKQLDIQSDSDPIKTFFSEHTLQQLRAFAPLLAKNPTKTNIKFADKIALCLTAKEFNHAVFIQISECFLTKKLTPLARKDTPTLRKKLTEDADRFLELVEILPNKILETFDLINKQKTFDLNQLWYLCGERLLHHYQQLKQQLRQLDFTDLEWKTYQLLQHSENALWIQYKLDQRIDHLLIDEFQDTNPTQWQLILPLLEEMAASELEKSRSIFLVGDEKQSIYSFRRAKPELQAQASHWLEEHLNAKSFPLNKSWRSSPAIINSVNAIFQQEEYQLTLPGFTKHETHQETLAGKVEVLPLLQKEKEEIDKTENQPLILRNPLHEPRAEEPSIFLQEGKQIAEKIQSLINNKTAIGETGNTRAIAYDDIFILLRKRSHVAFYETALRQAGIPYLGANKGTLLDCLEIQDMEALLDTLITPFNNLSIAQVLKSPLFDATDNDLMLIAKQKDTPLWIDRIAELSTDLDKQHPIHRAHSCINRWQSLADKIPVHDLLDRIYSEGNVLARYDAATPTTLKPRVQANLTRFLELALELDSGRYPSLMNFLHHLRELKTLVSDAPDEAPTETTESRVHIMTIHASKGLEAPVVFLADSITSMKDRSSYSVLVDWPVEKVRPELFQLIPGSNNRDSLSKKHLEKQKLNQDKENSNLLYVALTRAKQFLFISACLPEKKPYLNWYSAIHEAISTISKEEEGHLFYMHGSIETDKTDVVKNIRPKIEIDPKLTQRFAGTGIKSNIIAPSRTTEDGQHGLVSNDEDAKERGIAIHRCLDLLTREKPFSVDNIKQTLAAEMSLSIDNELILASIEESLQLIDNYELKTVFQIQGDIKIYNELAVQYELDGQLVSGIIDRMLVDNNKVLIIDYKSHQQAIEKNRAQLAEIYQQQMQLYTDGIRKVWPEKTVKAALLFTHFGCLYDMDVG